MYRREGTTLRCQLDATPSSVRLMSVQLEEWLTEQVPLYDLVVSLCISTREGNKDVIWVCAQELWCQQKLLGQLLLSNL